MFLRTRLWLHASNMTALDSGEHYLRSREIVKAWLWWRCGRPDRLAPPLHGTRIVKVAWFEGARARRQIRWEQRGGRLRTSPRGDVAADQGLAREDRAPSGQRTGAESRKAAAGRAVTTPLGVERLLCAMAMTEDQKRAVASGAKKVEETEEMAAGYETPKDESIEERQPEDNLPGGNPKTELGGMQLSMFEKGSGVRVRVGDAHNSAEMWEAVFASAEEANEALVNAGVLTREQVGDGTEVVGTGVHLEDVTAEELEEAGLQRHGVSTL